MSTHHHALIIVGSGPAGFTAALYAVRAGWNPLLLLGNQPGGQLTTTTEVENWPGGEASLTGPELMDRMEAQLRRMQVQGVEEAVESVQLHQKPLVLVTDVGTRYTADALIIATGAKARYLGLPSEQHYRGKGVSACATCDGYFFRGKVVAVVGGGNTAVEEACYLAALASKVYLIHRRNRFRAEEALCRKLSLWIQKGAVEVVWEHEVEEVFGDGEKVEGVQLKSVKGDAKRRLSVAALFIAIGHTPATEWLGGALELDAQGFIVRRAAAHGGGVTCTTLPGVFAAGDVADPCYRQAITAAAMGCQAALDAHAYLEAQGRQPSPPSA